MTDMMGAQAIAGNAGKALVFYNALRSSLACDPCALELSGGHPSVRGQEEVEI